MCEQITNLEQFSYNLTQQIRQVAEPGYAKRLNLVQALEHADDVILHFGFGFARFVVDIDF